MEKSKYVIKDVDGEIIYEGKGDSFKVVVEQAVKDGCGLAAANLSGAVLSHANLVGAGLSKANLRSADLFRANLEGADLSGAELQKANLIWANLTAVNLSQAKGLLVASEWLLRNFKHNKEGIYVYKAFGDTYYDQFWDRKQKVITEIVNPNRTDDCGCGINFATKEWIWGNFEKGIRENKVEVWLCLIEWEWMADVVVPYNTNGKARCGELKKIKKVDLHRKFISWE